MGKREEMARALRENIRVDATGLSPTVAGTFIVGFDNAVDAILNALMDPGEAWDGLPRDLIMWMDFDQPTPRSLFKHLEGVGRPAPDWLRNEEEMGFLDHVPSKGTRAVLVFKAMLTTIKEGK